MALHNTSRDMSKRTEFPISALAFYMKLYIAKHKKSNIKDIKSIKKLHRLGMITWSNLKEEEKDIVGKKYNEYLNAYRKRYAEYLKHMEPYMKKRRNLNISFQQNGQTQYENNQVLHIEHNNSSHALHEEQELLPPNEDLNLMKNDDESNIIQSVNENILPEPTPPCKTGKDFFAELQSLEQDSTGSWESLSTTCKRRHQSALGILKREYVENYIKYLNSLPSEHLFKLLNDGFI